MAVLSPPLVPTHEHPALPPGTGIAFPLGLSAVVAALLLVTSVIGLLLGTSGLYPPREPDPRALAGYLGQDGITVAAGLPLLLVSMQLARRGSLRGLLLWMGALFYVAYSYAYYALGSLFNPLFPAYVAIVSGSGFSLLYLLLRVDADAVRARFSRRIPARALGAFLMLMAVLPTAVWLVMIANFLRSGATPPAVERLVWPLDLGVAFPAMFWGGLWLYRRQPLGFVVGGLLLVKACSVGLSLVITTTLVTSWGAPSDPMLPFYATVGLGGLAGAVVYLRAVNEVPV